MWLKIILWLGLSCANLQLCASDAVPPSFSDQELQLFAAVRLSAQFGFLERHLSGGLGSKIELVPELFRRLSPDAVKLLRNTVNQRIRMLRQDVTEERSKLVYAAAARAGSK